MRASKRFARKLKQRLDSKQNAMERIPAVMGDGAGNLFVSGQNDYVYCSIGGQPAAVYNNRVINQIGLAVWVGRTPEEPNLLQVLSTRSATPGGENNSVGFAPAKRYEWHAPNGGQDPLAVHLRAITFLRLGVSGTTNTASTLYADLYRGWVYTSTGFISIPRQDINLFAHIPSTASKAALVLITIDQSGSVIQTKGSEVDITALTIADAPEPPAGTAFLCGAIRVYNGQTEIQDGRTNTDIWDGRFSWMAGNNGAGNFTFPIDGRLAVSTNIPHAIVVTKATRITEVYAYLKTTGSASSTIIDINKNGTTIYSTQANRPTIAYNDANGWVNTTPDILTFEAGDIITVDVDQVATGASDLVVVLSVAGTSGGSASSVVAQVVEYQSGAVFTSSSAIPLDDTIPQNTEGTEWATLAITPKSVLNYLDIDVNIQATNSDVNWIIVTLFQDTTAGALAVAFGYISTATAGTTVRLQHRMTAGTTSATTFKVRIGRDNAGTVTVNGQSGGRLFGGTLISSIKITEVNA